MELNGIIYSQADITRLEILIRDKTMQVAKEFPLIKWCEQYLTSEGTFFDIGADVGGFCVMLSKICKRVHAFEGDVDIRAQCKTMMKNNKCDNVTLHNNFITDISYSELENLSGYHNV